MKVHEFQAKEVLSRFGVTVPDHRVASTSEEAEAAATELGGGTVVVKAQIHAGGRGKGGGVKVVQNPAEAKAAAEEILGMSLVTHQTGPEGQLVRIILVESGMSIATELYAGIVLDRGAEKPVFMASSEGGMEIEEVAARTPEKIVKQWFDTYTGLRPYQARELAFAIGLEGKQAGNAAKLFIALARAYIETDASLAEINPLVVTTDGEVMALDAKINFDDNALYRHSDIAEYHDPHEEDPLEVEAQKFDLNYIKLDGNIGCMVNGAGLAMATMDLIKYAGGEPANFLDVGGAERQERQSGPHQHLRRYRPLRPGRPGSRRGDGTGRGRRSRGSEAGRHQRHRGKEDPERFRSRFPRGGGLQGRGGEGGRRPGYHT